uniref:VCBS domain-containing protein n=1 Tax=Shewanella algae TaxID=38313 RepID=UPI0031F5A527
TLTGLDSTGAEQTVSEAHLADGSAPDAAALTQSGSFGFSSIDGLDTLQVAGTTLTLAQLNDLGSTPVTITTAYGTLVLTGFSGDVSGGTVNYSYTLNTRVDNDTQSGATDGGFVDSITVTVTDTDNSTSSNTLDINIVDDVVSATDETASIQEDTVSIDGTVWDSVTPGADGASVSNAGTLTGNYGTLTLNADGSYTYTLDNSNPAVQALDSTESLTETFTYEVLDDDGDSDSAQLTITINGTDDGVTLTGLDSTGAEQTVSEAHLADGSAPDAAALTQSGSFGFSSIDGLDTLQVAGTTLTLAQLNDLGSTPVTITTAYGTLVLTGFSGDVSGGTVNYSYTLNTRVDNDTQSGATDGGFVDSITVTVTDTDNSTSSNTLDINIVDDAPYMPDTAPVTATATDIPDTLVGTFDLTGYTGNRGELDFNGFTITARGFTSSTDHTLTSANINGSGAGIGVASSGSPYHNIANEVDFREFADGTGVSEEVIIDLDPNTLAFGMKIEFANIFGGELESGVVEFWRDGQLISTQTFSSDAGNGDYAADFNVQDGGFDRVVIKATDNGTAPSHGDNSDFTISSIEFTGTGNAPAIAYASGEVTAQWGADGQGSLALAGVTDTSLVTASGEAVEVTLSGNTLLGQTDSGDLVFKLEFTPGTGHWDFYQYQTMQGTEDGDLDFAVTVTDADGDSYTGNIAVVPVFNYQVTEAGPGDQTVNLGNAEDIVIGDLDGTVVVPGQDYNIAFMVDSSGSIGNSAMEAMKLQLTQVFETLKASADSDNAGTVNIFLTDFDSQANLSVSVNLGDPDALNKLQTVIDSMDGGYWTGGGTNYEDVIKTTANWFHSDTALANSDAENLAFFITDGAPSTYQDYENTNPIVNRKTGETLDDLVNVNNFTLGEAFYANIGGQSRLIIDADGNLYQWSQGRGGWSSQNIGDIRAQGDGTYEISSTYNNNYWALQNALSALPLLTGNGVIVQAIGIGNNISTDTLQQFDSDGNVQTNVSADELADAILGNEITNLPGSDTLDGGAGNDIIFGDVIRFDGIQGQGYSALKAFIAGELGQSDATDAEIHGYISEHPNLFDKSGINDMGDIIRGGEGSDILFGQGGNDKLYGDNGNDMLFGGNGNDLLVGGNGDDWLTGGQGVDTFSWKAGETGTDHITDFELNKDKLDLSELLLGEEHNSLEQYFEFSVADGNTTISIDADLDGEFDQHIVLDGVDLFAEYGSDESDIINGLLGSNGDGPLLVDTQSANPGASYVSQSSSSGLDQPKPDEVF